MAQHLLLVAIITVLLLLGWTLLLLGWTLYQVCLECGEESSQALLKLSVSILFVGKTDNSGAESFSGGLSI